MGSRRESEGVGGSRREHEPEELATLSGQALDSVFRNTGEDGQIVSAAVKITCPCKETEAVRPSERAAAPPHTGSEHHQDPRTGGVQAPPKPRPLLFTQPG